MRWLPLLAAMLPAVALAQVPPKLAYQGRLLNADGSPVSGTQAMTFAIYDQPTGGNELWSEDQTVAIDDGFYAVVLGDASPIPSGVFTGAERYLEVAVAGSTLSPRQRIDSVAYALLSQGLAGATGCAAGQVPKWLGPGWTCGDDASNPGTVTRVSGTAPLSVTNGTTTPALSITQAGASSDGYLSQTDWNTFNGKQNAIQSTCTAGQYISGINPDGSVACGDDANTTYSAGSGLSLSGTTFSLLPGCAAGQVPKYVGGAWTCADDTGITAVKTDGTTITGDGVASAIAAVAGASLPAGTILPYAGATPPSGFLLADGSAVSRATYASLFAVVGTTYGAGDGSTTFNLPDLQGRVAVGKAGSGGNADVKSLGQNEGAALASRRPKHYHTSNSSVVVNASGNGFPSGDGTNAVHNYPIASVTVGPSANAPADAPAYLVVNYIIKY